MNRYEMMKWRAKSAIAARKSADGRHAPSGPNLTFESREGFPRFWAHASLAHAHRDFHHHYRLSTASAQGDCRRSERTAEACLAGTDRASVGGPRRHGRNHASDGEVQDLCLALARTFYGGRNRRTVA